MKQLGIDRLNQGQTGWLWAALALVGCSMLSGVALAQDDEEPGIIDFAADVQPILEKNCLECHGPDEAKNGFRVDDPEWVFSYVEPGDLESSFLWWDYLVTDDEDFLMPPASATRSAGLKGHELATIKLWIEEGAAWDWIEEEPEESGEVKTPKKEPPETDAQASLSARVWAFQGLFHPASVHFPIALLLVSSLFALLSFFRGDSFEPVAFHCLWIGALGAIASCIMGWSYAQYEGYGSGFSFDLRNSAIDRHRWLGVLVAVIAVAMIPVASKTRRSGSIVGRLIWGLGGLILIGLVSMTGYQGGELTYGEDHYSKEFQRLFPEIVAPTATTDTPDDSAEGTEADPEAELEEESEGSGEAEVSGDLDQGDEPEIVEDADVESPTAEEPQPQAEDTSAENDSDEPDSDEPAEPANEESEPGAPNTEAEDG